MSEQALYFVKVALEDAEGGWLRVWSDDLPGLILSGADRLDVCDSIKPAIRALLEHKGFKNIRVREAKPIAAALERPSPRFIDVNCQYEQYAVELEAA